MKRVLSTIIGASLLTAAPALAGINPAAPGLPLASTANNNGVSTYTALTGVPNNRSSSMCVDCHTVQPKAGGSHFVNPTATVGFTNSGGSGVGALGAIVTRDNGAYFKVTVWNNVTTGSAGVSKYGNGATSSVATVNNIAGARDAVVVAANAMGAYDIICESCHNVANNQAGGNNLLEVQPGNEWQNTAAGVFSEICVGCHGFMYTTNAANAGNANYSTTGLNANEVGGGHKSNNEAHWIKGTMYAQNHHVMTGDNIDATRATAGLLWTDNTVIHYSSVPISTSVSVPERGTYPQKPTWTLPLVKSATATNLTCTNCHTPAHGFAGSPGASILRNATYTTAAHALGPIARISDRAGWKKINDLQYCNQCHGT